MHPDKVGPEGEEEYKLSLNNNIELEDYLFTHELIINEEEQVDAEDDYTEEDLE